MPMSLQEILDRQGELAERFENFNPSPEDERDPDALRRLLGAASQRATAEAELTQAVSDARDAGYSWAVIGASLGITGQAAQQRYTKVLSDL